MNPLTNIEIIKHIMKRHGIAFNKKFGQNFLTDSSVVDSIAELSGLTENDCVLEIGPGIGTLTYRLLQTAEKVVSVEIDSGLIPVLSDTLSEFDNFEVINSDVLKLDIKSLIAEKFGGDAPFVIANLPYYITSPIIMHLLESKIDFKKIVVMVQKEVADRLSSPPGTKDYGVITAAVNYYADVRTLFGVPRDCFIPSPNVDSAVIELIPRVHPTCRPQSEDLFFRTIKASFAQRRKTLLNSISKSGYINLPKEKIENAIIESGLSPTVRGETLSIDDFAKLSDKFRG